MKKSLQLLSVLLLLCIALCSFFACTKPGTGNSGSNSGGGTTITPVEKTDYAGSLKLDQTSSSLKAEVTVRYYIDGDTTHFYVDNSVVGGGIMKARYLGVNTPESTGKIEEWGKAAARYTKNALEEATSIIVESDDDKWNTDTNGRHLVWIWYKTAETAEYRNLNVELLQEGLAIASNSANNRYGSVCMDAINQARALKLYCYSNAKDPDFPYGLAAELTIKELRCNIADYEGKKVAFDGIITKNHGNTVYVESYDPETDMYYGINVYYGYNLNGGGLRILTVGNEAHIVGSVQYYEVGQTYQISGLSYDIMRPTAPDNLQLISQNNPPAYKLITADEFNNKQVTLSFETEDEEGETTVTQKTYAFNELSVYTSVEMKGLTVVDAYTTQDSESNTGAMTLTCTCDGQTITVRTVVLYDQNDNLVTQDYFLNKTIDVKGVVDFFNGKYQIKLYSLDDVVVY